MTRTQKFKRLDIIFHILSWLLCFGTAAFLVVLKIAGAEEGTPLKETIGSVVYGWLVSNIPLVALSIIVKDKIRPVCWMVDVIMANIVFGGIAIYIVFGIWLIDEYIIGPLSRSFHNKYVINKEIDRRG